MAKPAIIAVAIGTMLAVVGTGFRSHSGTSQDPRLVGVAPELRVTMDTRYDGLPVERNGFAPHGSIVVVEPPPQWNPDGQGTEYPICPKPEWFPYARFIGPPVPAVAAGIDEAGFMFTTPDNIHVHRDGWVVTEDGRAFRAEALMDRMFPQFQSTQGN